MERPSLLGMSARSAWRATLGLVVYFVALRIALSFPWVQARALEPGALGGVLGILGFAPLLAVSPPLFHGRGLRARLLEGCLTLLLLVLATGVGMGREPFMPLSAQAYLVFPPLLWAALRFGVPGAGVAAFWAAALVIGSAHSALGAVALMDHAQNVLVLYTFLCASSLAALVLGALSTERREALLALTREHAFVSAVLDTAGLLVVLDARGRIVRGNRACETLLGGRDPRGQAFTAVFASAEEQDAVQDALDALACARTLQSWESHCVTSAGVERCIAWSSSPLLTESGEVEYVIASGNDLTDRRKLEAQLVLADRLAAMGTLAAGVGHEINNPLAYAMLSLELARKHARRLHELSPSDAEALEELLCSASEGTERVRRIVTDLKALARSEDRMRGPVDVRHVLESCIPIAWNQIRHRARLEKDYAAVPDVDANDGRLGQVFLNLLVNAAQAIPEGRADAHLVRVSTRSDAHGRVVVEVSDSGAGVPPHVRARVFEPFFTTKPVGAGVGLGLSVCHSIVTSFGGSIEVDSQVGVGTTFRVILPASKATPAAVSVPALRSVGNAPRLRILIADDEVHLATSLARLLGEHDVSVATSGRQAVSLCCEQDFDLVFCDLLMPDMTGMEAYAELKHRRPGFEARMVFMTGGAFTTRAREFLAKVDNQRLEKPFDSERLFGLIAQWTVPKLAERHSMIEPRKRVRSGETELRAPRQKSVG